MNISLIDQLDVRVDSLACTPRRAHHDDAGVDLAASETTVVYRADDASNPKRVLVPTGVQVRIPKGYVGLLVPRSSLCKTGLVMANSVGIIDAGYRGELKVALTYIGEDPFTCVQQGDRIAQLLIVPVALPLIHIVNEDDETWEDTTRGTGGFGSTGRS